MLQISATRIPPEMGLIRERPSVRLQLSLREAGLLISALKADAEAALDTGDAHLHRQLRDRAADLRETAAANARRILGNLGPKPAPRGEGTGMKANAQKPANAVAQQRAWRPGMREQTQMDFARRLNLEADIELQRGHHAAAERLAFRAARLQGWA